MAHIRILHLQNGKISYMAKVRVKDGEIRRCRCKTFYKLSEAKKWAKDTEYMLRSKFVTVSVNSNKHTLGDLIDYYIEHYLNPKSSDGRRLKSRGVEDRTMQLGYWKKHLGKFLLADINKPMIIAVRNKLLERKKLNGKYLTNSTANRYCSALSHVFSMAVKELDWMQENLFLKIAKLKQPRGRTRFLSDSERETLLKECKASKNIHIYNIVILALSTGARRSEITNLLWKDVDFKRQRITLYDTKNGEIRVLSLKGLALKLLQSLYEEHGEKGHFVFPRSDKKAPIDIKRGWENCVKRAGLENFRFHDLRHSAASYLAMNGATLLEIAEILGHKTLDMVKRYSHLTETHTSSVVERMNNKIFSE